MTLIIGAQGVDGCVMCSDRAESSDTNFRYVNKIYSVHNEVLSYDGDISIGEKILSEIERIEWPESTSDQIRMVELITRTQNRRYSTKKESNTSTLFMSFHHKGRPFIQFFNFDGSSFRIKTFESIGSGDNQAEYFLRTLYRPEYDVERLAEICSFVIQLISETAVNSAVQVSSEYPPECYIIRQKPYKYNNQFLYDINHNRILSLHHNLNNLFTEKDILVSEAIKRYW